MLRLSVDELKARKKARRAVLWANRSPEQVERDRVSAAMSTRKQRANMTPEQRDARRRSQRLWLAARSPELKQKQKEKAAAWRAAQTVEKIEARKARARARKRVRSYVKVAPEIRAARMAARMAARTAERIARNTPAVLVERKIRRQEYGKQYYIANKASFIAYNKAYRVANRARLREEWRQYRRENSERINKAKSKNCREDRKARRIFRELAEVVPLPPLDSMSPRRLLQEIEAALSTLETNDAR